MNADTLSRARIEAKRFLEACEDFDLERDKYRQQENEGFEPSYPRQTGNIKRRSMDLTRALANLRKPD